MSAGGATSLLFKPTVVGNVQLQHRVVLAPLTRNRANAEHVHGDLAVEYYMQRASVPGTLLITEAITIAPEAGGRPHVPGIWSEEQISAWKKVTDAVHEKGSYIFAQLRAYGRTADPDHLHKENPDFPYVSASDVPPPGSTHAPRPLTIDEIHKYIALYTQAALNAVRAGFDGVEVHGANSYLVDQFLSSQTNKRTDEYGGSAENRCRFALEVMESVVNVLGEKKVAIRLSPWGNVLGMRMDDPKPTFQYLVSQFVSRFPALAFIDLVEPNFLSIPAPEPSASNDFLRNIWSPRPLVSAGSYTREQALNVADTKGDLIAFGRWFIGNPDLPLRLMHDYPIVDADRSVYYAFEDPKGYIDFPTYEQSLTVKGS